MTVPMLQAKAVEIASSLQIEKFSASSGWLEAFRRQKNINSGHYVVNLLMSTKKQQMIGKGTWLLLVKDMLWKTNSTQMKLPCSTGEKLKPLVIGNAARPRAFKQNSVTPDNLPVTWKHNKKVWMTTAVFEDWLNQLNETMK